MADINYCEYISALDEIKVKCQNIKGYEQVGYIFNRADVDLASLKYGWKNEDGSVIVPSTVVTSWAMKDTKKGYKINQLKDAFNDTSVALETGDYRNSWTNTVSFKIFDNGPKVAEIVNSLGNGEFIVILENKDKDAENHCGVGEYSATYSIFGLQGGLHATATDYNANDDSIGASWSITMEETGAGSSSFYLFTTNGTDAPNITATKATLESSVNQ